MTVLKGLIEFFWPKPNIEWVNDDVGYAYNFNSSQEVLDSLKWEDGVTSVCVSCNSFEYNNKPIFLVKIRRGDWIFDLGPDMILTKRIRRTNA